MNKELNQKLKELKIEDYIWLIYMGIILFSWYANTLEKDYFITKNKNSKIKYRHIMILIFTILLIVYIYFFKSSFDSVQKLSNDDSYNTKKLNNLSLLASLLILVSGIIFLYIAIEDKDLNVELAFN